MEKEYREDKNHDKENDYLDNIWYIIITMCNCLSGFSWRLILYDCATGFRDSQVYFKHIFLLINIVLLLMLERKIVLRWQLRIRGGVISFGELNGIRKHKKIIFRLWVIIAALIFCC